ncbi:HAD hydrolase-like protein [Paenibacillus sp. D2_2]|uniref:HAD family hydrolase n=1 Tax=Paenibacillus sp. D2_2 TaxID=3073092 RepID=UPI0028162350|nr:HAD hydrolase-like protein [Paenibacillus sp. D2_2]WMT43553.1 HAD hydrolase-like protein [Paenibacillus sp. D2_2]
MEQTENRLTKPEAMIFDMDGTLFMTETLLIPAYHRMFDKLREEKLYMGETPPEQVILGCLGMLLDDIWKKVIPDASEAARQRANELLLELQLEDLQKHHSKLYPGVLETLTELNKQGVKLFVASNGLEHYVKGVARAHQIFPLFEALYSAGEYETASKVDLVKLLLDNHHIHNAWMVGDRSSDVEAGKKNGQVVIGCDYAGFGDEQELAGADRLIADFTELLKLYHQAIAE